MVGSSSSRLFCLMIVVCCREKHENRKVEIIINKNIIDDRTAGVCFVQISCAKSFIDYSQELVTVEKWRQSYIYLIQKTPTCSSISNAMQNIIYSV